MQAVPATALMSHEALCIWVFSEAGESFSDMDETAAQTTAQAVRLSETSASMPLASGMRLALASMASDKLKFYRSVLILQIHGAS